MKGIFSCANLICNNLNTKLVILMIPHYFVLNPVTCPQSICLLFPAGITYAQDAHDLMFHSFALLTWVEDLCAVWLTDHACTLYSSQLNSGIRSQNKNCRLLLRGSSSPIQSDLFVVNSSRSLSPSFFTPSLIYIRIRGSFLHWVMDQQNHFT